MLKKIRGTFVMLRECIVMSLDNIRGNKVRSFLTLLGIMIGVTAVIALISTVSGVSGSLQDSFSGMGAGRLSVSVTGSDDKSGMTPEDLAEISALSTVDGIVPSISLNGRVSYGKTVETNVSVSGRNAYYFLSNPDLILQGRALNFIDDDNSTYAASSARKWWTPSFSASIHWAKRSIFPGFPLRWSAGTKRIQAAAWHPCSAGIRTS